MQSLKGKNILVTGGSSGLGYAMARALALEGATVLIGSHHPDKLSSALHSLTATGADVYALDMDVRSESSIGQVADWIAKHWGTLHVLVNNAGIGMRTVNPKFLSDPKPFWEVSAAGFRDLVDTNLTGYFLVAKAMVPFFLSQGKGKIINISMNHETMKRKGFIPYGPSRAGAESLSLIMAEDLRGHGTDVNLLLPGGATDTGMIPEEMKASLPEGFRLLSPDIMAEPIVFLAGDESDGITGQRITATQYRAWRTEHKIH